MINITEPGDRETKTRFFLNPQNFRGVYVLINESRRAFIDVHVDGTTHPILVIKRSSYDQVIKTVRIDVDGSHHVPER